MTRIFLLFYQVQLKTLENKHEIGFYRILQKAVELVGESWIIQITRII